MTRNSVPKWDGEILQAARLNAGKCDEGGTVGIDFMARDGSVFAHAHFDSQTAVDVAIRLISAGVEIDFAANLVATGDEAN